MSQIDHMIETQDGLILKTHQWHVDKPKGIVCLVHGLGEHSGRYANVAAFLNSIGFSLVSYDLRGHGLSEGQKGHVPRYEMLLDDIQTFIDAVAEQKDDQNTPIFLYGHSLGGLQVITYLLSRQPANIAGTIVTSPALRPAFIAPAWKLLLGKVSVKILPSLSVSNEINVAHISRDQSVVDTYLADTLVHDRISSGLGMGILDNGEWALQHASTLKCPMLLMHGSGDQITSSEASQLFAETAGDICNFKLWEGLFHETHNEPEKDQVLSVIKQWLDAEVDKLKVPV